MHKIAPFLKPYEETVGAGLSEDNPAQLVQYRYPVGTVYADADPDFVYNLVKALDETYLLYEDAHPTMPWWAVEKAGVPPADAPFHEGAIRYYKEKGFWTDEHQAWNDEYLAKMKKLAKAWDRAMEEGQRMGLKSAKFQKYWMKQRAKALE
jgi:hypothetical protein